MTMMIQAPNGVYEVKKPGGKLGTKSMCLLAKLSTVEGVQKVPEEGSEDPGLIERIKTKNNQIAMAKMTEIFQEWAPEILPGIVIKGPYTYEDMPGEDQLAVFLAVNQESMVGDELFRVLPPTPA